jgi:hypothetical protein
MPSSVSSLQGTVWHAAAFDGWWIMLSPLMMTPPVWVCFNRTATGPDEFKVVGCYWIGTWCFPVLYVCPETHTRSQPGSNVFAKTGGLCPGDGADMTESATVKHCLFVLLT